MDFISITNIEMEQLADNIFGMPITELKNVFSLSNEYQIWEKFKKN